MRFDDSLKTVLAADASTSFGAQATFRQLVDLVARGRIALDRDTLHRLQALRDHVPSTVRGAVARSLALAAPPVELVAFFTEDEPNVASAVLRGAQLSAEDWLALIPRLGPTGRASLRCRRDLDPDVVRALEAFGSTDFSLAYVPVPAEQPADTLTGTPFIVGFGASTETTPGGENPVCIAPEPAPRDTGGFEIADVVSRIDAFRREHGPLSPSQPPRIIDAFRFETDLHGAINWTDAAPRGALIGLNLFSTGSCRDVQADGGASGAFRQRAAFCDARLMLDIGNALAGEWRFSAAPMFDPGTGRFTGFQGGARRPRVDENAARVEGKSSAEGLRRLVHELRTPTNAIAGFSELIEAQLLGPVAPAYRERATAIRCLTADLVTAIEDLDLAARIQGNALELRPGSILVAPLLGNVTGELQALAALRRCSLVVAPMDAALAVCCDDRTVARLLSRLFTTVISLAQPGEAMMVSATRGAGDRATIAITRPRALTGMSEDHLLNLHAEREAELPGAPLLGIGFALRLIRNLAAELGGQLVIGPDRVTVSLPTATAATGQASTI